MLKTKAKAFVFGVIFIMTIIKNTFMASNIFINWVNEVKSIWFDSIKGGF